MAFSNQKGKPVVYASLSDLTASTEPSRGVGSIWKAGSFQYEELSAGGTVVTGGNIRLNPVADDSGFYTPEQLGAVGDGSTDDASIIVNLINTFKKVKLTSGKTYLVNTQQVITSVDDIIIDFNGGEISTSSGIGVLRFVTCDNIQLKNLKAKGNEDKTSWEALNPSGRQQQLGLISLIQCDNAIVNGKTTAFRVGLYADDCENLLINAFEHEGVFDTIASGIVTDPEYGFGVWLNNCKRNQIKRVVSTKAAGSVLLESGCQDTRIFGGSAIDSHVNGINGDAVDGLLVNGFCADKINLDGILARGSNIHLINCQIENGEERAFTVTSLADLGTADANQVNGKNVIIEGCTAKSCKRFGGTTIVVESSTDLWLENVIMKNNFAIDCTDTDDGAAGIECAAFQNILFEGNTVDGCDSEFMCYIAGASTGGLDKAVNAIIRNNTIKDGANDGSNGTARALLLENLDTPLIVENYFSNVPAEYVIFGDTCSSLTFIRNRTDGSDIRLDMRTYSGTVTLVDNQFTLYPGGSTVIRGTETTYKNITQLTASTESGRGLGTRWRAGNFLFEEVASGGDITTAGSVELDYVTFSSNTISDITTTASSGSLPTPDSSITIADAASPTTTELLEYCVELETKIESILTELRSSRIIAT